MAFSWTQICVCLAMIAVARAQGNRYGVNCGLLKEATTGLRSCPFTTQATCEPAGCCWTDSGNCVYDQTASDQNANCVFPFTYQSTTFHGCTSINSGSGLWCSLSANYDVDRFFGLCQDSVCTVPVANRVSCGTQATEGTNCMVAGCCWDDTISQCYAKPVLSAWSQWPTTCPATCLKTRSRTCSVPGHCYDSIAGRAGNTIALLTGSQVCSGDSCTWVQWGQWSACSPACPTPGGVRTRTRTCPQANQCIGGAASEQEACPSCNTWTAWGTWGLCTATCGGGQQTRQRSCTIPTQCNTIVSTVGAVQTQACNQAICPTNQWLNWGAWSGCTVTCGGGQQTRTRTCSRPPCTSLPDQQTSQTTTCNPTPCNRWNLWSQWSGCTATCGPSGSKVRTRTCTNPSATNPADPCVGLTGGTSETTECNRGIVCPTWGQWAAWSTCTQTCGAGLRVRIRPCPAGITCTGSSTETGSCPDPAVICPLNVWALWGTWTGCSATCGNGTKTRTRTCTLPTRCNELPEGPSSAEICITSTACVCSEYDKFVGKRVFGGVRSVGQNTEVKCMAACSADPTCLSFDFESADDSCWLHATAQTTLNNKPSITHYRRNINCVTTPQPTTPATPTRPTSKPCNDTFTANPGMAMSSGIARQGVTKVDGCKEECLNDILCIGFDFDTRAVTNCWLHYKGSMAKGNSFTTHYVREDCTKATSPGVCKEEYELSPSTQVFDGKANAANTVGGCSAACDIDNTCYSFDYVVGTDQCFLHLNMPSPRTYPNSAINHYKRKTFNCIQTTSRTTSQPSCVYQYEKVENFQALNGQITSFFKLEECRTACDLNDDCKGFDFDSSSKCFFHLTPIDRRYENNDVDLYIKGECVDIGVTTKLPCVQYEKTENTLSFGGTYEADVNSVAGCEEKCNKKDECLGFDFNSNFACYLHNDAEVFRERNSAPGVDQYEKVDVCLTTRVTSEPPCATYATFANTSAPGGAESFTDSNNKSINTLDECKDFCLQKSDCKGLDFNEISKRCYLFDDSAKVKNTGPNDGVTHAEKIDDNCVTGQPGTTPKPGCISYSAQNRTYALGGVPQSAFSTDACMELCTQLGDGCTSFDYDSTPSSNKQMKRCFTHNTTVSTWTANSDHDVTHYTKSNECGPCQPEFEVKESTGSVGGELNKELNDVDACKALCDDDEDCFGFDFDLGKSECYFFYDDEIPQSSTRSGITQYRLTKRCPKEGTTGPQCGAALWKMEEDTNAPGGVLQAGDFTVDECKELCLDYANCTAFDYVALKDECWLHLKAVSGKGISDGVDHYALLDRCPAVATTPGTATTPGGTTSRPDCLTWEDLDDVHALGGKEVIGVKGEDACKTWCRNNSTCVAIDSGKDGCWWFSDFAVANKTETLANLTHSTKRDNCGPVVCATKFIFKKDIQSLNAVEVKNIFSVESCELACDREPECKGFDIDTRGQNISCWLQKEASFTQQPQLNVNFYEIQRCPNASITTPKVCQPKWEDSEDKNINGGALQSNVRNMEECKQKCIDTPSCVALDSSYRGCWLHDTSETLTNAPGVTHSVLTRCDVSPTATTTQRQTGPVCINEYRRFSNSHYISGVELDGRTPDECKRSCDILAACRGFDYNLEQRACWYHTQSVLDGGDLTTRNFVDHYTLISNKCTTGLVSTDKTTTTTTIETTTKCQDTFDMTVDTGGSNGSPLSSRLNSLDKCKDYCITTPDCYGFDFNVNSQRCWEFKEAPTTSGGRTDVRHYVIRRCEEPTTTTERTTESTTTEASTPSPPRDCKLDLVVLMDESGSIRDKGINNFRLALTFIASLVDQLTMGPDSTRMALLFFSDNTRTWFDFKNFTNAADYKRAIFRAEDSFVGMNTNLTGGLFKSRMLFEEYRGSRRNAENVVVVIGDGIPTIEGNALPEQARSLQGVSKVISIGVTSGIDRRTLETLASTNPRSGDPMVYMTPDFEGLVIFPELMDLLNNICEYK